MCSMSATNAPAPDASALEVIGADANNLRDIDCSFPLRGLSAVVGVSGSGKSSLLQDVIAAEAARRNVLFHGASRYDGGDRLVRPYVGPTPPALFVGQRPFRSSTRTTVGTATGILGDLRHLFLAEGVPVTTDGVTVPEPSPRTYVEWLTSHYRGKATVWAIPLRWVKSDGRQAAARLAEAGITRSILRSETDSPKRHETGRQVTLTPWQPLPATRLHALEAEVGTLTIRGPSDIADAEGLVRKAWDICGPDVMIELHDAPKDLAVGPMGHVVDAARDRVHPRDRALYRNPDRHLLSFNAPEHADSGACPTCKGIGRHLDLDLDVLIPAPEKSLHQGALALWTPKNYKHLNIQHETIEGLRGRQGFDPDMPWRDLPQAARALILDGTGKDTIQVIDPKTGKKQGSPRVFEGFRRAILRRAETASGAAKLGAYVSEGPCPACAGTRWSPEARALHAAGLALPQWLALPLVELATASRDAMDAAGTAAGRAALDRLATRAEMLTSLGLGHLSAARGMQTVSDGESRRLQIGATLAVSSADLMLLLDEPARGLHERDLGPMISVLRDLGKSHCILLNEHRGQVVQAADYVLTLGPGSGPDGGRVISANPGRVADPPPLNDGRDAARCQRMTIRGASMHNVRNQDVSLPLGAITAIVGVSGSGKSSFARGVLIPALIKGRSLSGEAPEAEDLLEGRWSSIDGMDSIRCVHVLHQRVPPRNRRSLVVTMTGALDAIAASFAATEDAKRAGLAAKDFGLNSGLGRCPTCLGNGSDPRDEDAPCPACGGRRYREAALTPRVAGLSIAETLERPVSVLLDDWIDHDQRDLAEKTAPLIAAIGELGLGHIAMGRRVDSLSGGEIQRLRVALTIAGGDRADGHLFFLDEPAAGLHRDDADRLMGVLRRMVDGGRNTVVIVEHNMNVVRAVDWLVEFGPGAGPAGGEVIASGSPTSVAVERTPTGLALSSRAASRVDERRWSALHAEPTDDALDRVVSGDLDGAPPKAAPPPGKPRFLAGRRLWEAGDLNLEVGKLLLDAWDARVQDERKHLLDQWSAAPGCKLVVNPALPDMRLWGPVLPRSAAKGLRDRLPHMGLVLRDDDDLNAISRSPARLRAALAPPMDNNQARAASLDHALAIGGGFVELEHWAERALATVTTAPLDLSQGLVGPQVLSLGHLSRLRPEGACPACRGQGTVVGTATDLLLKDKPDGSPQEAEAVLTAEAATILKGVWRSDARPFFRRLEEEGLVDPARLRQDLLHGFWRRPGHGTFLKSAKDDPDEVASWLRWDGLFTHIWSKLPRSKSKEWARAVERARHDCRCPFCDGTGHGVAAALLRLGGKTLSDWVLEATTQDLRSTLEGLPLPRARQKATRDRLLRCLQGSGRLEAPAEGHGSLAAAVRRAFVYGSA